MGAEAGEFRLRRMHRRLTLVVAVGLLASCGSSPGTVNTSSRAESPLERRQLKVPDGDTEAFASAAVSAGSALIVADVAGDPYGEIAAAGILDDSGSVRPVEPLPVLQGATAVSLLDGFAITGYRCAERAEDGEDSCVSADYFVTFLDLAGRVTEVVPVGPSRSPGEMGSSAGDGVVVAGEGAWRVTAKGVERFPVGSVSDICAARDGRVLALRRTPSDPDRPEDSPLVIQALVFADGAWQPVDAPRRAERARVTGCVLGGIVEGASVFDGDRWVEFAELDGRSLEDVVGLTAGDQLLVTGPEPVILASPAGSESLPCAEAAVRGWLSVDGRTAVFLGTDRAFHLVYLP